MSQIPALSTSPAVTMTSLEIAELTGKAHDKVTLDIENQLGVLGDVACFRDIYLDSMNRKRTCYKLPYRETMILISGYSVELRAAVVDRWMELERAARGPALPDFSDPVAAARAWADAVEARRKAEVNLAIAAPKLVAHDALMVSESTMSITDAAKHFGLKPRLYVIPYLMEKGYLTTRMVPTQRAVEEGILALRETLCDDGTVRKQAVVEVRQLERWRTRLVPAIKGWTGYPED